MQSSDYALEDVHGVLAGHWDLSKGEHPSLAKYLTELAIISPLSPQNIRQSLKSLGLPIAPMVSGHHVVVDKALAYAAAPEISDVIPLAPQFVRDIAGRTIATPLMPLPDAPSLPLFPSGCDVIGADHPSAQLIENVIFTHFRKLEVAPPSDVCLAGKPEFLVQSAYPSPASVTYKIRPDTFYQDGWRLPQVERLFVKPVPPNLAEAALKELVERWSNRPDNQNYEEFYDVQGGAEWFEDLFNRGLSIIPTLEAYNGRYVVNENFEATDVEPGRAVAGLHLVVKESDSHLIRGTILEVVSPGYATQSTLVPAHVVVSNGSGYSPPQAPAPHLPDLQYPHARLSAEWGKTWIPTHPQHFAEPTIWDWDKTGHFMQIKGPIWDPLHYVYSSTQAIVRATRKPVAEGAQFYHLPEELKARFHPVTEQKWYDTLNESLVSHRQDPLHPFFKSALDNLPLGKSVSSVGYHSLPCAFEYELDPAYFPYLSPQQRVGACPPEFKDRCLTEAKNYLSEDILNKYHVCLTESVKDLWEKTENAEFRAFKLSLAQKAGNSVTRLHHLGQLAPAWLPDLPQSQLMINVKRLFANREYRKLLQAFSPNMAAALFKFTEAALAWRRLRYRVFTKYPATYVQAWAGALDLATAENLFTNTLPEQHEQVHAARAKCITVVRAEQKGMPAPLAVGLHSFSAGSKMKKAHKPIKAS